MDRERERGLGARVAPAIATRTKLASSGAWSTVRARFAAAFVAGAMLFAPARSLAAAAESDGLALRWSAPPECPSAEDVLRRATQRAAGAPARELLEAEAQVEQTSSAAEHMEWKVRLRTQRGGDAGEREIASTTCEGVADATAVVLALALMPDGPESVPPPPPEPDPPREPDAAAPLAGERRAYALAVGASLAGDASLLPSPALGGSLTVAWRPGRLRLELEARRWGAQSGSVPGSNAGARFTMTSIGGRACYVTLRPGRFDLSPCAGLDGHIVAAPGFGADTNYAATAAWTGVAGGALARVSLWPWLAVRARAEAVVPLARPTFIVENEGAVHRSSVVGLAASTGLEVLFF